jgi:AraC-like DNA-binding protein
MRDGTLEGAVPGLRARPDEDADALVDAGRRLPYTRIVDHIQRNLARRIAVDELARIAQLSVFQLFRAFRREHAITPYGLVLAIRVRHAQRCLDGGATIAEAAQRAGFADQSHLTRHFKRLAGMTPKQYFAPARCLRAARSERQTTNPAAMRVAAEASAASSATKRRARPGSDARADTAAV